MMKTRNRFILKLFRLRILLLILFVFLTFISIAVFFSIDNGGSGTDKNTDNIYQTWKVQRFYKNGKLVVNDTKFKNLRFRINRDSSAEWISPNKTQRLRLWVSPDGSQLIMDNGLSIEDIETVYELKKDKLRFGKRNVMSHYEYVLVPEATE